ncbi:MAG: glycosyltransferase, partial [Planctomycetes bacterium]|nr:glycosyltransferase [Planctomycetota bacterium]
MKRPAQPSGTFPWRFEPFLRARHWGRVVPPLVEAADVLVVLDCHFAWVAAGLEAGRRVYLSLSAIARQEAFGSPPSGRRLRCWQYARLERDAIAGADATVVASETHARELREHVRPPAFAPVMLHPVFPTVDEIPRVERAEGEPLHVLTLGRLVPSKG